MRKDIFVTGIVLTLFTFASLSGYICGMVNLSAKSKIDDANAELENFSATALGTAVSVSETIATISFIANNQTFNCAIAQEGILIKAGDQFFVWYNHYHVCSRLQNESSSSSSLVALGIFGVWALICCACCAQHVMWKSQFNSETEENNCPEKSCFLVCSRIFSEVSRKAATRDVHDIVFNTSNLIFH